MNSAGDLVSDAKSQEDSSKPGVQKRIDDLQSVYDQEQLKLSKVQESLNKLNAMLAEYTNTGGALNAIKRNDREGKSWPSL